MTRHPSRRHRRASGSPGRTTAPARPSHAGHRPPAGVIGHAVRLPPCPPLGPRHPDEPPAARGVAVGHETARRRGSKFGRASADRGRRRPPRAGDGWHPDEVTAKIAGLRHRPRRAVDRDGMALDILARGRRGKRAAKRPLRERPKERCRTPRVPLTDKPASRAAAERETLPGVEHRGHQGSNDRAGTPHRPTRRRGRRMGRFESPGHARCFLFALGRTNDPFHLRRRRIPAHRYRAARAQAPQAWTEATDVARVGRASAPPVRHAGPTKSTAHRPDVSSCDGVTRTPGPSTPPR